MSALQKIKLKRNSNPMKILSNISAVGVRIEKTLDEEGKIEVVQYCAGDKYVQVIVIADGIAQITTAGAHNAMPLELCTDMGKTWQIAGHNNNSKEDDDDNGSNSEPSEPFLRVVKHKRSANSRSSNSRCFNCHKRGHKLPQCPNKKKKGGLEKAGAATKTSI
jgi:hypothetical protein